MLLSVYKKEEDEARERDVERYLLNFGCRWNYIFHNDRSCETFWAWATAH